MLRWRRGSVETDEKDATHVYTTSGKCRLPNFRTNMEIISGATRRRVRANFCWLPTLGYRGSHGTTGMALLLAPTDGQTPSSKSTWTVFMYRQARGGVHNAFLLSSLLLGNFLSLSGIVPGSPAGEGSEKYSDCFG